MENIIVNYLLPASYVLLGIATLAAIVLPLIGSLSQPKTLIKSGVGIVGIVAIFFLAWSLSGSEVKPNYASFDVTETSSKIVGGALITMYILVGMALLGILFTEVSKIFK